jgi:hypothetical protein
LLTPLCVIGPLERRFWCLNNQLLITRMSCEFPRMVDYIDRLRVLREVVADSTRYLASPNGLYFLLLHTMTKTKQWQELEYLLGVGVFATFVVQVVSSYRDPRARLFL